MPSQSSCASLGQWGMWAQILAVPHSPRTELPGKGDESSECVPVKCYTCEITNAGNMFACLSLADIKAKEKRPSKETGEEASTSKKKESLHSS